ncbi:MULTISPECIES: OsmC family protein [Halorussus]|uniref:OsmC family protein n=1 Tax=Halorussus TaxID=1070314 RepID=UPI000E21A0F8|nr:MULTISPECIES: OsmC family protein [Halorussus]NHN58982.1 OsmC family protein [Halorussus sp. JP-T4]
MSKNVITVSREGYTADNDIREFEMTVDATGEEAPDTLETLLAAYGSCYVPALRVGAEQRDVGDLGRIEIDVNGDLNDDDKLKAVQFAVKTEAEMDDGQADEVVTRANQLCKVHDALKAEIEADVTVESDAF